MGNHIISKKRVYFVYSTILISCNKRRHYYFCIFKFENREYMSTSGTFSSL